MAKITLKEIAKRLHLSPSTISKALNDSYEISEETKRKVREFAQRHNYQPNPLAKYLKLGKTNNIGVLLPNIQTSFSAQLLRYLHKSAIHNSYNFILMQSIDNEKDEERALLTLTNQGVDGILIAPVSETSNQQLLSDIHNNNCPVVIFDRIHYNLDTHKVGIDNVRSTYLATEELIKINRKNIIAFCGKNIGVTQYRLEGYRKALEDYNIPIKEENIIYIDYRKSLTKIDEGLKKIIIRHMRSNDPPNAILGTTETLTTRVLGVLADLKIQVPKEIAVIGFSNIEFANSLNPALSTVHQPTEEMASTALRLLLDLINSKRDRSQIDFQTILLETSIQLRKSTMLT
ncbi:LacI family DNA-binding transcriptional regulator [Sphingobacterium faecale]|uniref:LacI family DNA-binding transcriptional regulator n=1 Tax=Sphingobacterium faecale TaxID=2803775 RepID=A0ABS1R116_9SPHI|nr:LacI family DNA-binding transcriptional regulator [Sphingobacterium faecale]MBL1407949.1 LacI family DNA-binding transcriptional regulator [Sphingobacterium faecale]